MSYRIIAGAGPGGGPRRRPGVRIVLGDDDAVPESDSSVLRRVDSNVTLLVKAQDEDAKRRTLSLILTGVGLVFAAAKLGFIAVPHIKRWRDADD